MVASEIMVNSQIFGVSEKNTVHLGQTISTTDRDCIAMAEKNNFWRSFNKFIANFGTLYYCIKIKLFSHFCCSFYGVTTLAFIWCSSAYYVLTGESHGGHYVHPTCVHPTL